MAGEGPFSRGGADTFTEKKSSLNQEVLVATCGRSKRKGCTFWRKNKRRLISDKRDYQRDANHGFDWRGVYATGKGGVNHFRGGLLRESVF